MKQRQLPMDPPVDPIGTEEGFPVLAAFVRDPAEGFLSVWCKYCQRWHLHGRGEGHRWAHCIKPGSPYQKTGYFLRVAKAKPPGSGILERKIP